MPIYKGREGLDKAFESNSPFLSLADGEWVDVAPLHGTDDIVSFHQHQIWLEEGNSPFVLDLGTKDDPGRMIGSKSKFRALMHCIAKKKDEEAAEKVYSFGITVFRQFCDIEDAIGESIKGKVIRVTRKGKSLNTQYTCAYTGRSMKLPEDDQLEYTDLVEFVGPQDREGIIEILREAGVWKIDEAAAPEAGVDWAEETDDAKWEGGLGDE